MHPNFVSHGGHVDTWELLNRYRSGTDAPNDNSLLLRTVMAELAESSTNIFRFPLFSVVDVVKISLTAQIYCIHYVKSSSAVLRAISANLFTEIAPDHH
jgi:hypothetical protein